MPFNCFDSRPNGRRSRRATKKHSKLLSNSFDCRRLLLRLRRLRLRRLRLPRRPRARFRHCHQLSYSCRILVSTRTTRPACSIVCETPRNSRRFSTPILVRALHGESIVGKIRSALVGCKVGVVMLTPEFVAKKWPVFEWLMLEARAELCGGDESSSSSFRLLHDVCALPASIRWYDLGWPRYASGTATVWLDVLQQLPLLRKLSRRVLELRSDKLDDRAAHGVTVSNTVCEIVTGRPSSSSSNVGKKTRYCVSDVGIETMCSSCF